MKNTIILFIWIIALGGCKKKDVPKEEDPKTAPLKIRTVRGEWLAAQGGSGGTNNFDTYKNLQYNFEVGENNQPVEISLVSGDIDVQFALFDPIGQRLNVSSVGRSLSGSFKLNAGKYRIVVCAARRAVGKFEFIIQGILKDPEKIASQTLQSNTQNWGTLGGGGKDKSFKNHFYTFEITDDNSSIDVELESPDTDIAFYVYDELGQALNNSFFNERYRFFITAAKKGVYTVMAATGTRGSVGTYRLNIFGKVNNLKRVESQATTIKGTWANNSSVDTYSLQLTPNTSPLDIEFSSADAKAIMDLQNNVGARITYTVTSKNTDYIVRDNLPKGEYRIVVYPGRNLGSGGYSLSVHGQFINMKKI